MTLSPRTIKCPIVALATIMWLHLLQISLGEEHVAVPDEVDIRIGLATVRELYNAELRGAKTDTEKKALALQIKKAAAETSDDLVSRFAALKLAQLLSVESSDFDLGREITEDIAGVYEIDGQTELINLLQQFSNAADSPQKHLYVARHGLSLTDQFFASGQIENAALAGKVAYQSAKQSRNDDIIRTLIERGSKVTLARKVEAELRETHAAVINSPNDPQANLRYGQLLCFGRSRWDEGMPYLAKSDSILAAVAREEMVKESDRRPAFELADAWMRASNSLQNDYKPAALTRAAYWYDKALNNSSGLTKRRIQKAIEDLEAAGVKPLAGSTSLDMSLNCRDKGRRLELLTKYGGDEKTEKAVQSALAWLKNNQRRDGSWSLAGPYADGATQENSTAATAMAILAFQGAGHTHQNGDFKEVVAKAWNWLSARQTADGCFVQEQVYNARLYTQAQCTIALCELYALTKDDKLREPAQSAISYATKSQDLRGGGWRYTPGQDSDLSVTAWFMSALQTAQLANLEVKDETLANLNRFLDATEHQDNASYSYKPGQGPTRAMTAAGLLCRQHTGWKSDHERLREGVGFLREISVDDGQRDVYYTYYATQLMFHMGGEDWAKWNAALKRDLPRLQIQDGREAGSWPPAEDRWGAHGGRLYVTCLSVYSLQAYYRHTPVFEQLER